MEEKSNLPPGAKMVDKKHFIIKGEKYRVTGRMSKQIPQIDVIEIPVEEIKPDDTNPNIMSVEKYEALKRAIRLHPERYVYPIAVDQHYNIIDGFHRWKACKELKIAKIPCVVRECADEVERKMWRQVYNKVRGEHDRVKDKADFLAIFAQNRSNDFVKLLGTPKDAFLKSIGKAPQDQFEIVTDQDPTAGYMKSFLTGNLKQITLVMKNTDYVEWYPRLQKAGENLKASNNTETLFKLIEFYEDHHRTEKKD